MSADMGVPDTKDSRWAKRNLDSGHFQGFGFEVVDDLMGYLRKRVGDAYRPIVGYRSR